MDTLIKDIRISRYQVIRGNKYPDFLITCYSDNLGYKNGAWKWIY
ncbi:MAG: hypothetical protein ACPL28_07120 [bacterium]